MSPADPPIVAPSGRRAYGWPRGQEFQQLLHFVLAGVALVLFDHENIAALGRHLCFRKAAYADKRSGLVIRPSVRESACWQVFRAYSSAIPFSASSFFAFSFFAK